MAEMKSNVWSAGTVIHGYTMLTDAHVGEMAFSGKAKSPTGQVVFFKKYRTPSATVTPWYKDYVAYQKEIKHRIETISKTDPSGRNQGPTYRLLEFFEDVQKKMDPKTMQKKDFPVFCQVIEYIDGAKDLKTYLTSAETTWEQRQRFAAVFLFAMNRLHSECKIIHTDLKPENVLLIPIVNNNGNADFQIKIIDLDFAILKDKQAPWHGLDSYIGTPGYFSPEHQRGEVPTEKSDVFTCGLILYEILSVDGHPYAGEMNGDVLVYKPYEAYPAPHPKLRGSYGSSEKDAQIAQMLQRMLDPDPDKRPTALEVQRLLVSKTAVRRPLTTACSTTPPAAPTVVPSPVRPATPTVVPSPVRPATAAHSVTPPAAPPVRPATPTAVPSPVRPATAAHSVTPPAAPPVRPATPPAPKTFAFCKLKTARVASGARVFPNSKIGNRFLEMLEPEAKKYYSKEHFQILFRDGKWFIKHCAPAGENKTSLNKKLVEGEMELHNGDIIEAASQDGSKTIMPLTVEIGG